MRLQRQTRKGNWNTVLQARHASPRSLEWHLAARTVARAMTDQPLSRIRRIAPPLEVTMRLFAKPPELDMAGTMFNLVRQHWLDVEKAKTTAAAVLHLGQAYIYPRDFSTKQRAIAVAMIVATTEPCAERLGKAGCMKLMQAAADFASLHRETRLFNNMKAVMMGLNGPRRRF